MIDKAFLHSNELDNLDPHEVFYNLSLAYIESSISLCKSMSNGDLKITFSNASVINSLFYHSAELFLKAHLIKNNIFSKLEEKRLHDLNYLKEEFVKINGEIDIPFISQYLGFSEEEIKHKFKNPNLLDQYFRYHLNKDLKKSKRVSGFEIKTCLDYLITFEKLIISNDVC